MTRRLRIRHLARRCLALGAAGLLTLSPVTPALAQPAPSTSPVVLTADHIEYNTQTGAVVADGHVRATRDDSVITADHLTGDLQTGEIEAAGNVTLTQGGRTTTGASIKYNYRTRVGQIEQVLTKHGPWTAKSQTAETSGGQIVASNAVVTPCDPQHPAFLVRARKVLIVPDDYLTAYDATLYVYGVPVFYIPQYTASLKPGRNARSGPSVGYNNLDGAWIEYGQWFPVGEASNQLRIRYGTRSGISGEDILSERFVDHTWSVHFGRAETFDQNGNQFNLDQTSLDLTYDTHQLGAWPVSYSLEAHAGNYAESATGMNTTRQEAVLNLASATFHLSPSVTWAVGGQARADLYGTGQYKTVLGYTLGVTDVLNGSSSVSLTYNFAAVTGASPFQFDAISPDSTVALSYSYGGTGFLQSGGASVSYSFLSMQTSLGIYLGLAITPQTSVAASGTYNTTLQQWTEVDYFVTAQCDCVGVGLVYRTFPQTPTQNQLLLTIGLTPLPGTSTTVKF